MSTIKPRGFTIKAAAGECLEAVMIQTGGASQARINLLGEIERQAMALGIFPLRLRHPDSDPTEAPGPFPDGPFVVKDICKLSDERLIQLHAFLTIACDRLEFEKEKREA